MVEELVATPYRNMESGMSSKTTYMLRVKSTERRPFIFIFRLNIFLRDLYKADAIAMEIEEWKKKFQATNYAKSFSKVLLLKLVSAIFYQIFIFSQNDSPLETIENVFYFI